jgi:hypothetical protein
MQRKFDSNQLAQALGNFGRMPMQGPTRPTAAQAQQPEPQPYGPVSFETALGALGPSMDNGQIYTNPQAYQGYQNAARAVGAMYGMQPRGYFTRATPDAFMPMPGMQQRPFDAQFSAQFPGAAPSRPLPPGFQTRR